MDLNTKNGKVLFFFITWFGGIFGIHWFLLKNYSRGTIYLFTAGGFVVCWIYDVFKAFVSIFKDNSLFVINVKTKNIHNHNERSIKKEHQNPNTTDYYHHYINSYVDSFVDESTFKDAYTSRRTEKTPSSYVVIDVETTGLEPCVDKIIEISAIKYVDNKEVAIFNELVNPCRELDPYITNLTKIRESDLANKPSINIVLPKFIEFIEDFTLVAHNASFDIKMIVAESYRSGIQFPDNKIQDTLKLSRRIFSKSDVPNYKLETLKNYLGLAYNSHRALDDCYTCASVYQVYLTKKN